MTNLELKSNTSLLTERSDCLAHVDKAFLTTRIAEAMLVLKELTGILLAIVGVIVLIGNLLIGTTLLLRGPTFVIELLAK
jgi:hypothetical protein